MSNIYESLKLGGPERNAEYLGTFVAWLVSNNLLSMDLENSAARSVASVSMQDMTGAAFLTTEMHGELKPAHLNEKGRGFSDQYFVSGRYREDYDASQILGKDDWQDYAAVSPKITAAYVKFGKPKAKTLMAKILQFPKRSG